MIKICLWNVKGASRNKFVSHAWIIIEEQHPAIFILLETKSEDHRGRKLCFNWSFMITRYCNPLTSVEESIFFFFLRGWFSVVFGGHTSIPCVVSLIEYDTGGFDSWTSCPKCSWSASSDVEGHAGRITSARDTMVSCGRFEQGYIPIGKDRRLCIPKRTV